MNQKQDIELPLLSRKGSNRASFQNNKEDTPSNSDPNKKKQKFTSHFTQYLDASADPKKYAPRASFLRWITFTDMMPHVRKMNEATREFTINDLPNPEAKFNVEAKVIELDLQWANELKTNDKPQFYKALYRTFLKEIIQACLLVFLENFCKILYSIFMGQIISIITSQNIGDDVEGGDLFFSATLLSILVIISIFAKGWSYFVVAPNLAKARLTVSGLLYKKLNSISMTSLHEIKIGKVINLIANDLNDIQHIFFFPLMIVTPYMIALGTYVMWGYFGPSCLIGVASLILVVFCQIYLSNLTGGLRQENKKTADERVKYTHEVIEGIRLIKMYTWDRLFQQKISDLRKNEHKTFLKIAYVDSLGINLSGLCVYLNILLICIVHTMTGGQLTPANVYASMMILMYLSALLLGSHQARVNLVNTRVVLTRVEEVLKIKDVLQLEETAESDDKELSSTSFTKKSKPVVFKNFTGYWNQTTSVPCLSDISHTFNPGTLTAVIGKIGSGKSSLLLSFLREMPVTRGTLDYSGKLAYVEQDPIIFSGTVQQNILFGRDYNESRYKRVIADCCLTRDLQLFPHRDMTMIGERGVNLSGGQKARISLARALYSESDIYLLDDPFSALDSRVSREIFDSVFKGSIAKEKIVILVTHHLNFAKEADHVLLLEEGRVAAEGSFEDLEKMNIGLLSVFKVDGHKKMSEDSIKVGKKEEKKDDAEHEVSNTPEKNHNEEAAQVSWSTYKEYFKAGGSRNTFLVLALLFIANHGLMIYFSRYVGFWAEDQTLFYSQQKGSGEVQQFNDTPYIQKLVMMFSILFLLSYAKTARVYQLFYTSNSELHQKMLNALVRSKVLFFDINPVGRILNRFSNDMGIFDKIHGRVCLDCFDNLMNYVTVIITVCLINPLIIFSVVLVMFGLYQIRKMFEKPMRTVKKVELMSKGPMISAIPATLQGLIVIRVYNQGGRYVKDFMNMLYNNIKAFVYLEKTIRLFGFLLDTPIQLLTISAVWFFLILIFNYHIAAGMLGLSLMYLLKIGDQGSMMIRQTLMIDINMQSAQRMIDYSRIKSEAPVVVEPKDKQVEEQFQGRWPTKGEIDFNQVSLRYREELGLALNGLTLKIPGGLKVACIGRTGAGKSSIIQALFRMVEIEDGPNYQDSAIKIDGIDIKSIGLNLLRSRLSIIPQTPVIFADTIKKNLDPFGTLSDDRIWNVLEEVGLKDYVSSLQKGLDTDMTVSSTVFSTGQKQLICLARAIISKSKVIILDEATANVDVETDSFIQRAIMEKFKDCTVLTVAHRLITIANYDKVVVIDAGKVAEYDTPYSLLVERIGDSRITRKNGLFAEMVRSTGRSMAQKIFDVARDHYCAQIAQRA